MADHSLDATSTTPWFRLGRHADPDPDTDKPADGDEPDPAKDDGKDTAPATDEPDTGDDKADDKAKPKPKPTETVDYWKRMSRENERRAKENADKAKKFDDLEAAKKTAEERLAEEKAQADKRAEQALARAVTAEVKAKAADDFADPADAADVLARDPAKYLSEDGDIDEAAIETDLAGLLERKPHWRKAKADPPKPKPKPDPGQGSRGDPGPVDFRTADEKTYAAELAKYGLRTRS